MVVVEAIRFSRIAVLVSWIKRCSRCGCAPVISRFVDFDFGPTCSLDMLVVVPTPPNCSVESRYTVLIATGLEGWVLVVLVSGFFLVVDAQFRGSEVGFELAC